MSKLYTVQEFADHIMSMSDPEAGKRSGGVYILFADGELVYTKSGDLLWQRTFHVFEAALDTSKPWNKELVDELNKRFTLVYNGHKFIFIDPETPGAKELHNIGSGLLHEWGLGQLVITDEEKGGIIRKNREEMAALCNTELRSYIEQVIETLQQAQVEIAQGQHRVDPSSFADAVMEFKDEDELNDYIGEQIAQGIWTEIGGPF